VIVAVASALALPMALAMAMAAAALLLAPRSDGRLLRVNALRLSASTQRVYFARSVANYCAGRPKPTTACVTMNTSLWRMRRPAALAFAPASTLLAASLVFASSGHGRTIAQLAQL
jgi:hypothetical protein